MPLSERIVVDPEILDGKPVVRGMRRRPLCYLILIDEASKEIVVHRPRCERLRKTTFRCSPALLKATLDRFSGGHVR